MSRGHITKRGKSSWRIKFDIGRDPVTSQRRIHFQTIRGTKKEAEAALTKALAAYEDGGFVRQSAITVAEYARHWFEAIAPARTSEKTRERYGELIDNHIIPHIGAIPLQKLDAPRIDAFYAHLQKAGRRDGNGGLAPQTVLHIHRLLSQILTSAVKAQMLRQSPMLGVQTTPKVRRKEIQVLDDNQLAALFKHLKGGTLYMPVLLAASTGMRRGEILAQRWRDIDFQAATLQVAQVIQQTAKQITIKEPKTERSRRAIALPSRIVRELQAHKKEQAAWRLKLGLGKDTRDLVFPAWDGELRSPRNFSKDFSRAVAAAGLPHVTFHGLRHTHITHLLRSCVPVHVVAARAGHANPTVTLNIYAHLLPGQQEGAAAVMDAALEIALQD